MTNALVFDAAGKWQFFKKNNRALSLGFEAVTVQGYVIPDASFNFTEIDLK